MYFVLERFTSPAEPQDKNGWYAVSGGVLAVIILVLLLVVFPEWHAEIWIGLTLLGIIGGISTFFVHAAMNERQNKQTERPAGSAGRTNGKADTYRPPASARGSARQRDPQRSQTAAASPTPTVTGDPYRALLCKVMYDQSRADQLIQAERKRMPLASLDDLCRKIIERLEQGGR
jgi:hypothetical protein